MSSLGFYITAAGEREILKGPNDRLDYWIDFTDWLIAPDVIQSATVMIADSPSMVAEGGPIIHDGQLVQQWISGGALRDRAEVTFRITTAEGRVRDHAFFIRVARRTV